MIDIFLIEFYSSDTEALRMYTPGHCLYNIVKIQ